MKDRFVSPSTHLSVRPYREEIENKKMSKNMKIKVVIIECMSFKDIFIDSGIHKDPVGLSTIKQNLKI